MEKGQILVTGINGFVGRHLARGLVDQGHKVLGVGTHHAIDSELEGLNIEYFKCDLTDQDDVDRLPLEKISGVINLAGLAAVGKSFDDPELYMKVNVEVLSVMCDRVKALGLNGLRIVAISSGAVYASHQEMPLTESSKTDTESSPYAASKLAMEDFAQNFRDEGYNCVIARPFNHIGPGQATGFLLPDLYEKVTTAKDDEIKVGNLETERDYTDVRDVARAYISLATKESLEHLIYNVCSGKPVAGTEMLNAVKKACDRTGLQTTVDKDLFRPSDSPVLFGNNSRLRSESGWAPTISFEQSVEDFVNTKQHTNRT